MSDFPPQYAEESPPGSGVVVIADTNGSPDMNNWEVVGVGELGDQSWEEFAADFGDQNGHLDNFHDIDGNPLDGDNLGGGGTTEGEDPLPGDGGEGEGAGDEGEGGDDGKGDDKGKGKDEDSRPGRDDLLAEIAGLEMEAAEIEEQLEQIEEEIEDLADELAGIGEDLDGPDPTALAEAAASAAATADTLEANGADIAGQGDAASTSDPLDGPASGDATVPDVPGAAPKGGEPVGIYSGAFSSTEVDLHAPGPGIDFALSRTYSNQLYARGLLGPKWRLCFEDSLRELASRRVVRTTGDGTTLIYEPTDAGWDAPLGVPERLERDVNGWRITDNFGVVRRFAESGQMISIADRFGNEVTLDWDDNQLRQVLDPAGRSWDFSYSATGLLTSVTGADGGSVRYGYNAGRLASVTRPDPTGSIEGPAYAYAYRDGDDERIKHNLTRISESGGGEIVNTTYGDNGSAFNRVTRQEYQGGRFEFDYDIYDDGQVTLVTGLDGTETDHQFNSDGYLIERRVRTRGLQPGVPASYESQFETGENGLPSRVINPGGGSSEYTWDDSDPLNQSNLLQMRRRPNAGAPNSQAVTESYQYGPFSQMRQISAADNTVTDLVLDALGMPVEVQLPPVSIDGGGAQRPVVEIDWRADGQIDERRDPGGLITRYEYFDDDGRRGLVSKIKQIGSGHTRTEEFERDVMGRVTERRVVGGRTVSWDLDDRGRPLAMLRDGDLMRTWEYDQFDRVLKVRTRRTEPDGSPSQPEWAQTVFAYDAFGRMTESRVEAGGRVLERLRYGYNPGGNVASIEAANGSVQEMTYDERGLIIQETRAAGTPQETTSEFRYNADGVLEQITDPRGNDWLREVDGLGRVTACVDPTGCRDETKLDPCGRPTQMTRRDPGGVLRMRVDLERNGHGRIVARRTARLSAAGAVLDWLTEREDIDIAGNPIRMHAASGAVSSAEYDAFGQPLRQVDPAGNEFLYEYESTGFLLKATRVEQLAGGGTIALERNFERDLDGRPIRCVDSAGREETMRFDGQGFMREATLADGSMVATDYDAVGRLTESRTLDGAASSWSQRISYDTSGLVTEIEDPAGNARRFDYDPLGRLTRVRDATGVARSTLEYDPAGAVTRLTDARGVVTDQVFDAIGRITSRAITAPAAVLGPRNEAFEYDTLGHPARADNDNVAVTHKYNSLGLMTEATSGGRTLRHTYTDGRRAQSTYPSGLRLEAGHDELGRLTDLTIPATIAGTGLPTGPLATWSWQGRKLPAERTTPGGVRSTWRQDRLGRPLLLEVRNAGGSALIRELEIRDAVDRVLLRETKAPGGSARRAEYDARGQITAFEPIVSVGNPVTLANSLAAIGTTQTDLNAAAAAPARTATPATSSTYDDAGNRTERTTGAQLTAFTYDNIDRLVTVDGSANLWDAAGNLVSDGTHTYGYDFASRLSEVTEIASGAVVYSCGYDALGRPSRVHLDGRDLDVVHDGNRPIELRDPAGVLDTTLVWGAREGELVALGRGGTAHYGVNGLHGDVAMLTDGGGAVSERYGYDDFGARTIMSAGGGARAASVADNPFGYLGRPHVTSDLVDLRARHLHTGWGRFTTADPASGADGLNPYLYAGNDPLSRADYDGHSATVVGGALGFAAGVGWVAGSMINAGIYEATGGDWGEQWQGFGHYGSQVAMFTLSGLAIGAAVDLAPVAGGFVAAALMGAGLAGLFAAPSGDWSEFGWDSLSGAAFGVGFWGVGKVAAPLLGPVAAGLAGTALGRTVIAGGERLAGSSLGSGAIGAFNGARNWLGVQAEQTWGNQIVSSITGPILRSHISQALAGQGVAQGDMALMNRMVGETFETMSTSATSWHGFRDAFWKAARGTDSFAQLFPNATGTGAPVYGNLGRLNIHHLVGRARDLVFAESNLVLVPNALDTPFIHSAQYLTGTQQWAIRRGLRTMFPRQWTAGALGAAATQLGLLEEGEQGAAC